MTFYRILNRFIICGTSLSLFHGTIYLYRSKRKCVLAFKSVVIIEYYTVVKTIDKTVVHTGEIWRVLSVLYACDVHV